MNFCNTNEHVPEAERNHRVIQERVRATFHRFPYHSLPRLMVMVLVTDSTNKLNYFPPKGESRNSTVRG
jgi:hypothetical protein